MAHIRFVFRVTSWPPNDLQKTSSDQYWPQNKTLLPNLTLWHLTYPSNMSFHRYFGTLAWLRLSASSFKSQNNLKWPKNDFKWPIRTWKRNFLTKSHFGACNMSFHRFFLNAESIALIRFEFRVTKWPQVTNTYITTKFFGQISLWGLPYVFS